MNNKCNNIQELEKELINFRHTIHQNAEIGFKEFKTQNAIKQFLINKGIQEQEIKTLAITGLITDVRGRAEPQGKDLTILIRADIDALSMTENNPHLPYQSQTNAAHMCGHDGHTTCLLGFLCLYLEILDQIPSNKVVRLLFQPSEEGPESGALQMIKEGCLEGVDEVYGYHNSPNFFLNHLALCEGVLMGELTIIKLIINGKGGHGSTPELCVDPVQIGIDFHDKIEELRQKYKDQNIYIVLPYFHTGQSENVISSQGIIQGNCKSLVPGLAQQLKSEVIQILEDLKSKYNYTYELSWKMTFPCLVNTQKETQFVQKIGKQQFGEDKVGNFFLPIMHSEDFAFYLMERPGCFFFIGGQKEGGKNAMVHSNQYDFNDEIIMSVANFWLNMTQQRFLEE